MKISNKLKKNLLVTGANGQLGSVIKKLSTNYENYNFFTPDSSTLDITKHCNVNQYLNDYNINTVINCAAYTKVDDAESNIELADSINHLAVGNLAKLSKEKNINLIHISTDYVFDGKNNKPYSESDLPNPQTIYGSTKLEGERVIKKINPVNSIIVRTSWLYSEFGDNFVNKMLSLAKEKQEIDVVNDQFGSPTRALDLANFILQILPEINNENVELYHYSNSGVCNRYEFAKAIFKLSGIDVKLNSISSKEFLKSTKRPIYSPLNCSLVTKKFKLKIPHWKENLSINLNRVY